MSAILTAEKAKIKNPIIIKTLSIGPGLAITDAKAIPPYNGAKPLESFVLKHKLFSYPLKALASPTLAASLLFAVGHASAVPLASFKNGDFDQNDAPTQPYPSGWVNPDPSNDPFRLYDPTQPDPSGLKFQTSRTGGKFLAGRGLHNRPDTLGQPADAISQLNLTGLVVGRQYEISFEQSISSNEKAPDIAKQGYWEIIFGDEHQLSAVMQTPAAGVAAEWVWQTLTFTATRTTQDLTLIAWKDNAQDGLTFLGIDSIFIGDPGTNPNHPDNRNDVPAPASPALLVLGLLGLSLRRRQV